MRLNVFADYHQINAYDSETGAASLGRLWPDDAAVSALMSVAGGAIGLGTLRAMTVSVDVEALDDEPALDKRADHVAETTVTLPSGELVIAGPTQAAEERTVMVLGRGTWRARWTIAGADTVDAAGVHGDERYRLELWPADEMPSTTPQVSVLRQMAARGG